MKTLRILFILSLFLQMIPSLSFAHPDFDDPKDLQKLLYASFMNAYFKKSNSLEQKLSDGRTYTINITSNRIFLSPLLDNNKNEFVLRYEAADQLIALWTSRDATRFGTYTPKFKPFKHILHVLHQAIEHQKFDVKTSIKLAHDAKQFNAANYTTTYTALFGHADGDDALLETDLKILRNNFLAEIKDSKKNGEITNDYVHDVDHMFEKRNASASIKKNFLPDRLDGTTYVQHYTLNVDACAVTTFILDDRGIKITQTLGNTLP